MIPWQTAVIRLAMALAFGAVIGVEREWRLKQAGLKTMSLVALGSAAFAMLSNTFGPENHNPGQIAAAVVGGIGFLGAGLIMHRGLTVQGLTTAATLWASAAIGVASGLGQAILAVMLTGIIVFIQIVGRGAENRLRRFRRPKVPERYELRVECELDAVPSVNDAWKPYGQELRRSLQRGVDAAQVRVLFRAIGHLDLAEVEAKVFALAGVNRVELRALGVDDD